MPVTTVQQQSLNAPEIVALLAKSAGPIIFDACTFEGLELSRLPLNGCEFSSCVMSDCSFTGAFLRESRWIRCRAGRTRFEAADLVDAEFIDCDLNNTTWRRAKVSAVLFKGCKLTGADFDNAGSLVPPRFEQTLLVGANLRRMSFRKSQLRQLDMSEADLSGCDFRDACFEGGSLRNARMALALFDGCDLRGVDLGGLTLADWRLLKGATISARQAADLLSEYGVKVV